MQLSSLALATATLVAATAVVSHAAPPHAATSQPSSPPVSSTAALAPAPAPDSSPTPAARPASGQATPTPSARGRWQWPVGGGGRPEVVAPFDAPNSRWGPGHRGLDLLTSAGSPVTAVADGVVTHRGTIAGRGTVSVLHPGGVRSTYEPVDSDLTKGAEVRRGEVIGHLGPQAGHCAPRACLHLGARRGADYLDPLPFFGGGRVILLPVP